MNEQELFTRLMGKVETRLSSHEAADVLRRADFSTPFGVADALANLVELVKGITPQNVGAHHQYVTAEAEDALCAVCGCSESENAPECGWK